MYFFVEPLDVVAVATADAVARVNARLGARETDYARLVACYVGSLAAGGESIGRSAMADLVAVALLWVGGENSDPPEFPGDTSGFSYRRLRTFAEAVAKVAVAIDRDGRAARRGWLRLAAMLATERRPIPVPVRRLETLVEVGRIFGLTLPGEVPAEELPAD